MAGARRRATYEDLLRAPPEQVAEIVAGELQLSPRPAPAHSRAATTLASDLEGPFDRGRGGPGGWIILAEPELHLGDDVLVPDIAGWRRERMAAIPETAFVDVAPDGVCEVLSPSTERLDRTAKLTAYAAAGVEHVWLVNPSTRTLEVLRRAQGGWMLVATYADAALVRAEPFEAVELELQALWRK